MFSFGPGLISIKESSSETGQIAAMQRVLHSLSCVLLMLVLVLTGPGAASGATMLVICGGEDTSIVWLDQDGDPVDPEAPQHKCPECLSFDLPPPATVAPSAARAPLHIAARLSLPEAPRTEPIAHLRPDPRGSPAAPASCRRDGDPRHDTWSLPCTAHEAHDPDHAGVDAASVGPLVCSRTA